MKVSSNIFQINSGIVNCYLITTPAALVLIDSGMPFTPKAVFRLIHELGRDISHLTRILITHADGDHTGGAPALLQSTKARLFASEIESRAISAGTMSRPLKAHGIETIFYNLGGLLMSTKPCNVDAILNPGDLLPILGGLHVLDTPGHTPGHLSFFLEDQRILFSGDSIQMNWPRLSPSTGANTWDETIARQSFEKQLELKPSVICGGHGIRRLSG